MEIERGNVETINTNGTGWIVGFGPWLENSLLRQMSELSPARRVGVKWMCHHTTDDPARGKNKPVSKGRTISILVSQEGGIRLEFWSDNNDESPMTCVLKEHGDYVIWGEGIYHQWSVEADSTVLTVRWIPI